MVLKKRTASAGAPAKKVSDFFVGVPVRSAQFPIT
jgi:hypothetical protein